MNDDIKCAAFAGGVSIGSVILLTALLFVPIVGCNYSHGVDGFGPVVTRQATVERLYVDSGEVSHYMVGTDKGVFEVGNGWLLGVWNADELYSKLQVGQTYTLTTKGNTVARWYMQEYPYVIAIEPATTN